MPWGALEEAAEGALEGAVEGGVEGALEGAMKEIDGDVHNKCMKTCEEAIEGGMEGGLEGALQKAILNPSSAAKDAALEGAMQGALDGGLQGGGNTAKETLLSLAMQQCKSDANCAPYDDAVASCARTGDPDTCAGVVGQLGLEPGVDAPGGTPLAENSQSGSGRTGSVKKGTHSRAQIDFTESLSVYKMDFAG